MEGTISVLFLILTFLLFYSFFSPQTINFTTCGETIVDFNYFSILPLTPNIIEPMVGDLLGDGHLRFTHKDVNGKVRGNAHYAMTTMIMLITYGKRFILLFVLLHLYVLGLILLLLVKLLLNMRSVVNLYLH